MKESKMEAEEEKETKSEQKYTRELLSTVVRRIEEVQELVPTRLPEGGYIYKEMDKLNLKVDQKDLLDHMAKEGYLEKRAAETTLVCPTCHEANVAPIFKCKSCGALAVTRERLIEHTAGGHIHPESAYKSQGTQITCPSCNRSLTSKEWRTLGAWFVCAECNERQAQMSAEFKCLKDGTLFTSVLGEFVMLYKYTLAEKAKSLLGFDESSIIDSVIKILSEDGKVERNLSIEGKSGVEHIFDIEATIGKKRLLIDVAFSSQPVDDAVVLASFAKTFEVKDKDYLLIVWPGLTKSAQNLVKFYRINTIQATTLDALNTELKKHIKEK